MKSLEHINIKQQQKLKQINITKQAIKQHYSTTTNDDDEDNKKPDINQIPTATASPHAWIAFGKEKHHLPLKLIKFRASHLVVIKSN